MIQIEQDFQSPLDRYLELKEREELERLSEYQRTRSVEACIQKNIDDGWTPGETRRYGNIVCCFGVAKKAEPVKDCYGDDDYTHEEEETDAEQ